MGKCPAVAREGGGGGRRQLKLTDAYLLKWKSTKNIIAAISIFLKVVAFSSLVQQF